MISLKSYINFMKLLQSIVIILVLGTTFSCRKENSEDIDQENIWTDYRVIINHQIDKVIARATFKNASQVGENLKLGKEASVTANAIDLEWSPVYNWYEQEIPNAIQVKYVFTDNDENTHNATLNIDTTITYDSNLNKNDSLVKGDLQFVPWANATALNEGEVVNLVLVQGETIDAVKTDSVNATGVYIPATFLNLFQLGNAEAHFEKWVPGSMTSPTSAGGLTWGHYISRKIDVKIVN